MIIPEHRQAIVEQQKRELDDYELELLSYLFHHSLFQGLSLSVEIYMLQENYIIGGIIEKIDMQHKRFKIQNIWCAFQDFQKILD